MVQLQQLLWILLTTVILATSPVYAQLGDNSGQGGVNSGANGVGGSGSASGLDANDAFSDLSRDRDVGATGNTGRGFSESSVAAPADNSGVTPGGIGGGVGGFGGVGGVGGFGNMFDRRNSQASPAEPPVIRTRLRSAVQVEPRTPDRVQRVATSRFHTIPSQLDLRAVTVSIDGRTAVLTGSVQTERGRRMSHLLMQLEPGIGRVENRVSVDP